MPSGSLATTQHVFEAEDGHCRQIPGLPDEDLGVLEPPRLLDLDVAAIEQNREQLPRS
jgi:hypothetical protein